MPALLPSELPVLARTRRHWIVMFSRPHPVAIGVLLAFLLGAVIRPDPFLLVAGLVFGAVAYLRWQAWRAEWVIITRRRIIRVRGIPETTKTESSLRIDRVSGAVLEQTVWGKLLNYGTIELEAPGSHPDVRSLTKIARPHAFYLQVRKVVFGGAEDLDPDDAAPTVDTAPLPLLDRRVRRTW